MKQSGVRAERKGVGKELERTGGRRINGRGRRMNNKHRRTDRQAGRQAGGGDPTLIYESLEVQGRESKS